MPLDVHLRIQDLNFFKTWTFDQDTVGGIPLGFQQKVLMNNPSEGGGSKLTQRPLLSPMSSHKLLHVQKKPVSNCYWVKGVPMPYQILWSICAKFHREAREKRE